MTEYWERHQSPQDNQLAKFTMWQIKDPIIRRKVAIRAKQFYDNTGRHATSELKKRWVASLQENKSIF